VFKIYKIYTLSSNLKVVHSILYWETESNVVRKDNSLYIYIYSVTINS